MKYAINLLKARQAMLKTKVTLSVTETERLSFQDQLDSIDKALRVLATVKGDPKPYICVDCKRTYKTNTPDISATQACKCPNIIRKEGLEILHVLNTIQDCTVEDAPDVIRAIRKDTLTRFK